MVLCEICKKQRAYKKYWRHLRSHLLNGLITKEQFAVIIFETKKRRNSSKIHITQRFQKGRICCFLIEG